MNKAIKLLTVLLVACMITNCGIHYRISGRVIDAETKEPIEGAVVAINWSRYKWLSAPGLGANRVKYGSTDSVTDSDGNFVIVKYMVGESFMGIYKPGYICWSNRSVFNPTGKTHKEMYLERDSYAVDAGMVVELQPIDKEGFPIYEHARFVAGLNYPLGSEKFSAAIEKEEAFYRKEYRRKLGNKK